MTRAAIGFRFECSGRSSKDLQAILAVTEQRRMVASRLEAVPPSNKDNIDLTPTILQVEGAISGSQGISPGGGRRPV